MNRQFDAIIERDEEGYFVGWVPALPGCHSQARTLDELRERLAEAAAAWLASAEEEPPVTEFVGVQRFQVPA